jgi:hypothetical protein
MSLPPTVGPSSYSTEVGNNVTRAFLANADDGNLLGEGIHTVQKNKKILLVDCKETGLEAKDEKGKYIFMSHAGQNRSQKLVIIL